MQNYRQTLDDLHSLPFYVQIAAHTLAAFIVIAGFGFWKIISLPFIGQINFGWIGLLISFLWIVGLTNSYNFMDGMTNSGDRPIPGTPDQFRGHHTYL